MLLLYDMLQGSILLSSDACIIPKKLNETRSLCIKVMPIQLPKIDQRRTAMPLTLLNNHWYQLPWQLEAKVIDQRVIDH